MSSLPNVLPAELEVEYPVDPFAPRDGMPTSDALKIVADGVNRMRNADRAIVLITHYQRLLDFCRALPPTLSAVAHPCDESSLAGAVDAARLGEERHQPR